MFDELGFTVDDGAPVCRQRNEAVAVGVFGVDEVLAHVDGAAELLLDLPNERLTRGFSWFELASRELPKPVEGTSRPAAGSEHQPVAHNHGSDHLDAFHVDNVTAFTSTALISILSLTVRQVMMARRWLVLGVGLLAYIVAMLHRSSLGVAGLEAAEHFEATPSVVSTFVVMQVAVYALAQIPVGTLLDRFGPRLMMTTGSAVMAFGQLLLATVDVLAWAYVARVLVGLGDACIYVSLLALIPRWFPPTMAPLLAQLAGMTSVFGQLAAVYGLLPLIQHQGWRFGLLVATGLGAAMSATVFALVRNSPHHEPSTPTKLSDVNRNLAETIRHPGTQLGFFVHLTSGFSMNAFVLMWGLPYLQQAQGLSQAMASLMFTLITVSGIFIGPLIGVLTARHPLRRSNLALTIIWASLFCWLAVLLWPGQAPLWLIVLLVLSLAAGGPGTAVGFDYPRTLLPLARIGVASGVVIMGGFLGATLTILLIGWVLDVISDGASSYTFEQWQQAMWVQIPVFVVGLLGIYITRTRLRRQMRAQGVIVPTWREAIGRQWRNRRQCRRR